jgi:hypothetical protein
VAISEFDLPGDRSFFFFAQHANTVPQRSKISITTHIDGVLWASLYTGIAFPAHIGLNVDRTSIGLIDVHDVRWTDIDAVTAAVTFGHINKGWHFILLFPDLKQQPASG